MFRSIAGHEIEYLWTPFMCLLEMKAWKPQLLHSLRYINEGREGGEWKRIGIHCGSWWEGNCLNQLCRLHSLRTLQLQCVSHSCCVIIRPHNISIHSLLIILQLYTIYHYTWCLMYVLCQVSAWVMRDCECREWVSEWVSKWVSEREWVSE